jgi:uncharacterized protein (TIGR02145 family)
MILSKMQIAIIFTILFVHEIMYAQSTDIFIDSRDSTTYKIVTIGTQTWMAENLNFKSSDSWCYADSQSNCENYGRLYTWEAAKIACPDGWHLPTEEEWRILERYLGMSEKEIEIMYMRGETMGTKLKSKNDWELDSKDNSPYDIFGFNALPGGYRLFLDGSFVDKGKRGSWWSSTPDGKYAMRRSLFLDKSGIDCDAATRTNGFSVRCVKD